ncbi:hypothetical protein PRUB_b1111 [Pseudoalteromonas rubra]|uniref:Uncharacterized protein n=1 Tax=Pseudoalteromonas rubra TaxID=43658 RepID=A0A8T0C196_9GAMM|nr:hypothetical protein [Pseudoalteromonas rubra]KAF7781782.1 hypothetical protein PRUB_b1111 [Pseudoalteromonas rubra]
MSTNKPTGSKDDPSYVRVTNLPDPDLAFSMQATAHAKGFIYNGTITPGIAEKYKSEGSSFCMRNLNAGDSDWDVPLSAQETNRITGPSSKHGYGLALMPVYNLDVSKIPASNDAASVIATQVLDKLSAALIPIGTTVWLQLLSSESGAKSDQIRNIEHQIFQSGYSVGILGDEVQQQQQTNGRVLESTYTPFEDASNGTSVRSISIGDNTGANPIYWAIQ